MTVFLAAIAGGLIGAAAYLSLPSFHRALVNHLGKLERKCGPLLDAAHVNLEGWHRSIFLVAGPLTSAIVSLVLLKPWWLAISAAIVLAILTRNISLRVAAALRNRRIARIKTQLVDALGLISNALRSGLSLQQGFQLASEEMPAPISEEFSLIMSGQRLGKTFDEALHEFKERVPLEEIELLISSLVVLRETGGNIIETLEVITHTIGEEQRVKSKIKTLTTQGIAQAVIISALPFFLAAALYLISPGYIQPLFSHPLGWAMLALMLLMQGVGMWMMKKIVTIKV